MQEEDRKNIFNLLTGDLNKLEGLEPASRLILEGVAVQELKDIEPYIDKILLSAWQKGIQNLLDCIELTSLNGPIKNEIQFIAKQLKENNSDRLRDTNRDEALKK